MQAAGGVGTDGLVEDRRGHDAYETLPVDVIEKIKDVRGNFTAYADGSVRILPITITPQKIRAMATRAGGEAKPDF